jgi:predicted nuclease with TOPRIM domain
METKIESTTDLKLEQELKDLNNKLLDKEKEINKLKNSVSDLKEMLKLQKDQLLESFNLEKSKLEQKDLSDHVIYQGVKYDIIYQNQCKWIGDDVKKKFVDENHLALVISKY